MIFIEFIGVTLVNKTVSVSSVQLNKNIMCTLRHMLTTQNQVSSSSMEDVSLLDVSSSLSPFPAAAPIRLFVSTCHAYCLILLPSLSNPQPPSPLTASSVLCVSMLLFLFWLLNYFVEYSAYFSSMYTKIGMIHRRLAWSLYSGFCTLIFVSCQFTVFVHCF